MACLLGLVVAAPACAHRGDVRGSDAVITEVQLVGVRRFTKGELLNYLSMGESSRLPWKDRFLYFPGNLPLDAERIAALYRAHGYYDAEVVSITPSVRPGRDGRPDRVTLRVVVREGAPTLVHTVRIDLPEPTHEVDPEVLRRKIVVKEGHPFEVPELNRSAERLREWLREAGHARAQVHESAEVGPGRGAEVRFAVRPGPRYSIGAVHFEGLGRVPERYVRAEVRFAAGEPYAPRLVRKVEAAVYALDVFDTVTVEERRAGPRTIDLVVRVRPAQPQSIRIGGGFGLDPVRWAQRATILYSHKNLFRNLTRLDLSARAGYAELPSLFNPLRHGPVVLLAPSLRQKGLIERRTVATLAPTFEVGIWEGYQFYSPTLRAGLSRFFGKLVEIDLTYNLRFVDFFNVSPALPAESTILGLDFRDPYLLSYIEPALRVYLTDSILRPSNGAILGVVYDLAGLGGDFSAHRVHPSVRAYWTPHWRVTFAARFELGWIVPWGPRGGAPIDMRLYLGGSDTVRGWGLRRLAPQVFPAGCTPGASGCAPIPIGGNTMLLGSLEARVRATKMLGLVAFVDAGDVRPGVNELRLDRLSYSVGPGIRLDTPIGLFRLDLGVRLNSSEYGRGQKMWALHLGLGEAF